MGSEPSDHQVPPPKDWQTFERHMRDLFEAHWHAPAKMHGRAGQPQCGVDVYGQPKGSEAYHGLQCKLHDLRATLAVITKELPKEAAKAAKFKPRLAHFILATTAPSDTAVQAEERRLNARKRKPFTVQVIFWDDILHLYNRHLDIFARHYPGYRGPSASALHQLPSPPGEFVGRKKELSTLLDGIEGGANISGLRGMGGIGKTALALVLAHRLKDRYRDAQFYLDLKGTAAPPDEPLTAAQAMAHVLRSFEPTAKLPEDEALLAAAYRSALDGKRTILLMDNARQARQIAPLVPPPGNLLLVTSRWRFAVQGLAPVDLDVLSEPEAVELLLAIEKRIGKHAPALARLCGLLPLALRAAGSLLQVRRDLSPADFLKQLEETRTRLKAIGGEGVEMDVEACLDMSYRHLSPEAAGVFRQLAVFPASFDAAAEEAVCRDAGHQHLSELLRYSLVDYDQAAHRYRLHDLARIFAEARLTDAEGLATRRRHADHYLAVLAAADELYLKGGAAILRGLGLLDLERANIEAGQAWAASRAGQDDGAAHLCSAYPHAGAYCLSLRHHPRQERIPWLEAALAAARHLKDRPAEGVHLGNLGLAYADLGDSRKAIEFYEKRLAIGREIGDRRGQGNALGNLGNAYLYLGDLRKAIEFFEQALVIAREIGDSRGEGTDLGNLGLAYADLGDSRKAIEFHEQALMIDREIGNRRGEGQDLGNLGSAHHRLGEVRKAIDYYQQGLVIDREIGDRRGEGADLGNLGIAYADLGDIRKAIECFEQQLVITREIGDRRGEGNALGNLGNAHLQLGDPRKAIVFFEQALMIDREIGNRRGEGNSLFNRSLALRQLGERARAVADAEAALAIFEEIEDPNAEKVRRQLAEWRGGKT